MKQGIEKQDSDGQEYRDNLAKKIVEIANSDPENIEKAHAKARGFLEAQQETEEYKEAEKAHRKEAMESMPFDLAKFEASVGMKNYTVDELVEVINSGYEKTVKHFVEHGGTKEGLSPESRVKLEKNVSDALEAIKRIKDNGFILDRDLINGNYSDGLSKLNGGYPSFYADKSEELQFSDTYFLKDLKTIRLLVKDLKESGIFGDGFNGIVKDLFGSFCDCCSDIDCDRLIIDNVIDNGEKINTTRLRKELKKRRDRFFQDHEKDFEEWKKKIEKEREEIRQEQVNKEAEANLGKFDPSI